MNEKELRREISRVFQRANLADDAMTAAGQLLARELGEVRVLTVAVQSGLGDRRVASFLESREFPFRGAYTSTLSSSASLVMLLGAWGAPQPSMQLIADHLARELSLFETKAIASGRRSEAA